MRPLAAGVVLPVHNEEQHLPAALAALDRAVAELTGTGIPCLTVIVLDACSDRSQGIARQWAEVGGPDAAAVVSIEGRNVGQARRSGVDVILAHFADVAPHRLWLATTDADSQVPPTWLTGQLAQREAGVGLWGGRVDVADWAGRTPATAHRWRQAYAAEARPVHGASLGVAASTYLAAGGFRPLRTGEDQALHDAALAIGAVTGHGGGAPVVTSARRIARAPLGFAHALSEAATASRPPAESATG